MATKRLPAAFKPTGLGPRGLALWKAYAPTDGSNLKRALLVGELCRAADRLDRLDALISGDVETWARVRLPKNESEMVLRIDSPVTEARQLANVVRQMLNQLDDEPTVGQAPTSPAQIGAATIAAIVNGHADGGPVTRAS